MLGRMRNDRATLVVDDPFTGEPACEVPQPDDAAIAAVLDRARAAAQAWRSSTIAERRALCERATAAMESSARSIALDITRMMGKPVAQSLAEVKTCAARARYLVEAAEHALADVVLPAPAGFEKRIARAPLGVVLD